MFLLGPFVCFYTTVLLLNPMTCYRHVEKQTSDPYSKTCASNSVTFSFWNVSSKVTNQKLFIFLTSTLKVLKWLKKKITLNLKKFYAVSSIKIHTCCLAANVHLKYCGPQMEVCISNHLAQVFWISSKKIKN